MEAVLPAAHSWVEVSHVAVVVLEVHHHQTFAVAERGGEEVAQ